MTAPAQGRSSARWLRGALLAWPTLLSVALVWPLLTRAGHPLARDLVFVPDQPLTWNTVGLADGSPRAVPLDAVVAVLTTVVDGGILARIVLPGILVLAAVGVMRCLPWVGPVGLVVASGAAVWNPFVVERLALGQWALLTSYAALPWLTRAAASGVQGRLSGLAPVVGWAALASLTPTGGLLAVAVVAVQVALRRGAAFTQLLAVVAVQAPWVVAGLVGSSATVSDPAGVAAFAPDTESPAGPFVALVGLGGIWDGGSEPSSRTTFLAPVAALAVVVVLVLAARELHRGLDVPAMWWVLGIGGLSYALVLATGPGQEGLREVVARVPGCRAAARRPEVPGADGVAGRPRGWRRRGRLGRALGRRFPDSVELRLVLAVPVIVAPLLLLPDGDRLVWQTVDPVLVPPILLRRGRPPDTRVRAPPGRASLARLPAFSWVTG